MAKRKAEVKAHMIRSRQSVIWDDLRAVTKTILNDLQVYGAKQVNLRLNQSGVTEKRPVFVDWIALKTVTDTLAKKSDITDYGKDRFGDPLPSEVYSQALDKAGRKIIERDWNWERLFKEKRIESRLLVQKAGLKHQKFIGIIAEEASMRRRCIGTLTVSFTTRPRRENAVKAKMKQWASWPKNLKSKECVKSRLVEYIESHIALGGPVL